MIEDKITPQLRKRFLQEIKKTRDTGKEHGFHLCIENNTKLSAGNTCIGDECSIKFQSPDLSCPGRKVQGEFHTHPYLKDVKKQFNITFKTSNKRDTLLDAAVRSFLEEKGPIHTTPSHSDTIDTILGKCSKKLEGTVCIGSDLDQNRVECWTTKNIDEGDCIRAMVDRSSPSEEEEGEEEKSTLPHKWVKPLFDVEIIDLKDTKRRKSP